MKVKNTLFKCFFIELTLLNLYMAMFCTLDYSITKCPIFKKLGRAKDVGSENPYFWYKLLLKISHYAHLPPYECKKKYWNQPALILAFYYNMWFFTNMCISITDRAGELIFLNCNSWCVTPSECVTWGITTPCTTNSPNSLRPIF